MKTTVVQSLLVVLALSFLSFPSVVLSGSKVDPHGKDRMCHYCHTSKVGGNAEGGFLKNSVVAACLDCHGKKGASLEKYLQRMLPDVKVKKKLIDYFAKHPDFSCHTCHNAMSPTKSQGKQLLHRNPHIQLDEQGNIIEKACLLCHTELPDYSNPAVKNADMRYNISHLCSLCHVMSTKKRGLGVGKRMSDARIRRKEQFEKKHDVSLPLGPNNKVVCASCHNPHQRGVILGKGGNTTASGEHRLVLEDIWQLCTACHLGNY